MIVRVWQAEATRDKAPAYRAHLESSVFPQLRALDGFVGAELLEHADDDRVEILVMSRWDSMDAVRGFAGAEPGRAVVEPHAQAVLTSYSDTVRHFEIAAEARP